MCRSMDPKVSSVLANVEAYSRLGLVWIADTGKLASNGWLGSIKK